MLNNVYAVFLVLCFLSVDVFSREDADSLVRFADLKFHSGFEKQSIINFVTQRQDAFNLFLAIDDTVGEKDAAVYHEKYLEVLDELEQKKIGSKKIKKQVKITYTTVHSRFLKKYVSNNFYPSLFNDGTYNCVSATMLYALAFDAISIPYKVMVSSDHVYLVANPGPKSIVIETTNPSLEDIIFTGEFKYQYVTYLKNSKLISEEEYRNQSTEEIFEAKFKEVNEAEFYNLPGIQYYNKAMDKIQNNEIKEAYELCQKAYYFFPDQMVKWRLYNILLVQLDKCRFTEVSDIDYLAHLSRFENTGSNSIQGIFYEIISHYLQYTDTEAFCDSMFCRLISQIYDQDLTLELRFTYYMQMCYHYQLSEKAEYYADKALQIKENYKDANMILVNSIQMKASRLSDPQTLLDTVNKLEARYDYDLVRPVIRDYKMVAYLRLASDYFRKNRLYNGEEYLQLFEDSCEMPLQNDMLVSHVEIAYATAAAYYLNNNYRTRAKSIIQRGLKYVPGSVVLNSMRD